MLQRETEARCQLILVDWNIVETEGLSAVKKLREMLPETVPLLFLADYDAKGMDEALLMQGTGVLAKPFFVTAFSGEDPGDEEGSGCGGHRANGGYQQPGRDALPRGGGQ